MTLPALLRPDTPLRQRPDTEKTYRRNTQGEGQTGGQTDPQGHAAVRVAAPLGPSEQSSHLWTPGAPRDPATPPAPTQSG